MDGQVNRLSEDALCSLLDKGVAWLEDFDSKLKNRAADLERKEADLAHRMELAEQLERDFAERERQIADARAQSDEFARRLADQEHALRSREQQDRGEVRGMREQYEAKLRELDDRDAALARIESELINRRRAVEVCESAIARFQQTFERVLETQVEGGQQNDSRGARPISATAAGSAHGLLRTAMADSVLRVASHEAGASAEAREFAPRALDCNSPAAMFVGGGDSWGEWQGPTR